MADIIEKVKESIQKQSEAQKEALEKVRELTSAIETMETPEQAMEISNEIMKLTKMQQVGLRKIFSEKTTSIGIKYNKETKVFERCTQSA